MFAFTFAYTAPQRPTTPLGHLLPTYFRQKISLMFLKRLILREISIFAWKVKKLRNFCKIGDDEGCILVNMMMISRSK
jgi:hypothetical protein